MTIVSLILRPDGSLDLSQNILPLPGDRSPEEYQTFPYARVVRALQIGQKLYQSGELLMQLGSAPPDGRVISTGGTTTTSVLRDLLASDKPDPILACMVCHAWVQSVEQEAVSGTFLNQEFVTRLASRIHRGDNFPLPDICIVNGLIDPSSRSDCFHNALIQRHLPILAASARVLARYAAEVGADEASVVEMVRQIPPGQVWNLTLDTSSPVHPGVAT